MHLIPSSTGLEAVISYTLMLKQCKVITFTAYQNASVRDHFGPKPGFYPHSGCRVVGLNLLVFFLKFNISSKILLKIESLSQMSWVHLHTSQPRSKTLNLAT